MLHIFFTDPTKITKHFTDQGQFEKRSLKRPIDSHGFLRDSSPTKSISPDHGTPGSQSVNSNFRGISRGLRFVSSSSIYQGQSGSGARKQLFGGQPPRRDPSSRTHYSSASELETDEPHKNPRLRNSSLILNQLEEETTSMSRPPHERSLSRPRLSPSLDQLEKRGRSQSRSSRKKSYSHSRCLSGLNTLQKNTRLQSRSRDEQSSSQSCHSSCLHSTNEKRSFNSMSSDKQFSSYSYHSSRLNLTEE